MKVVGIFFVKGIIQQSKEVVIVNSWINIGYFYPVLDGYKPFRLTQKLVEES
jgi:hypothetical protein